MTSNTHEAAEGPAPAVLTITLEIDIACELALLAIEKGTSTEFEAARLIAEALK